MATEFRTIAVLEWILIVAHYRHHDGIEGCEAATARLAKVNVEGQTAIEKIDFEIGGRISVIDSG